ncbi:HlyD family type I secretion periplasmic adaptor subunit [Rhodoblastus acidophilus]|uniref:Membrane fusion protein (MFP) family protein n=1 Tax=Rhodoblastus acidophilus TaxID=1074 RepID=A0A6N8DS38_RHOAC|nr:HlyD family type I secretion periplasmic adaptor subunit [Rhodoblastus acidophilus]MCW2275452.1 HlyD family secretion protein [Rhodoblastus acidophilus]MTV31991.1 HlyD family type I secretion periplasmic adaptor subunit [Rhodoblastus acidophilus]
MPSEAKTLKTVRSFQSEVGNLREAPDPVGARHTIHFIALAVATIAVICSVTQIDRVIASTSGKIVTSTRPTIYQALDTSIVRSIDVREGDVVRKGDVLATFDPTFADADVGQLERQVASLKAQIVREQAELDGGALKFAATDNVDQRHYNKLQADLFDERRAQYLAQLNSYDQKFKQTEATLAKLESDVGSLRARADIAKKVENMRVALVEKGAGSLLNQWTSTDARVEAERTLQGQANSIDEARHQLSSLRADREAFVRSWSGDLRKEMVQAQNALDQAAAQLEKAHRHRDLVRLVAEQDSIILTIAKTSRGSVMREGEQFITAMPLASPVAAEIHVAARDVGFIRPGDPAYLKIDAFNFAEHGLADGEVKWISENAFVTNEDTGQPVEPYYRVNIAVTKVGLINVPAGFRLIPGMTLVADINVGKRPLGAYVIDGLVSGFSGAMREP